MAETMKTLRELLALGDQYLNGKKIPDSRTVIELLASRIFACGRMDLFKYLDSPPETRFVDALRRGMVRVAKGEPDNTCWDNGISASSRSRLTRAR